MVTLKSLLTIALVSLALPAMADEAYQKTTTDALLAYALDGSLEGKKFDVVGKIVIYTDPKSEPYTFVGSDRWHPAFLKLDKLLPAQREAIIDECSPTPCVARLLVTVLPQLQKGEGPAQLQVDGWR